MLSMTLPLKSHCICSKRSRSLSLHQIIFTIIKMSWLIIHKTFFKVNKKRMISILMSFSKTRFFKNKKFWASLQFLLKLNLTAQNSIKVIFKLTKLDLVIFESLHLLTIKLKKIILDFPKLIYLSHQTITLQK